MHLMKPLGAQWMMDVHCYIHNQAHNQTFLEGGSEPGMVTQMNSKWGHLLVRSTFSMRLYSMLMLGMYLRLNMGYFGE